MGNQPRVHAESGQEAPALRRQAMPSDSPGMLTKVLRWLKEKPGTPPASSTTQRTTDSRDHSAWQRPVAVRRTTAATPKPQPRPLAGATGGTRAGATSSPRTPAAPDRVRTVEAARTGAALAAGGASPTRTPEYLLDDGFRPEEITWPGATIWRDRSESDRISSPVDRGQASPRRPVISGNERNGRAPERSAAHAARVGATSARQVTGARRQPAEQPRVTAARPRRGSSIEHFPAEVARPRRAI
ncbi:hypothetical protein ACTQ49_11015 [Luteococcus sp. Sow4_B9]|uniref:hypothetical protein n=1 Tax=Luteococcus sp. Sow4_B9 TaxID=3438792 RepID=UPI003F944719